MSFLNDHCKVLYIKQKNKANVVFGPTDGLSELKQTLLTRFGYGEDIALSSGFCYKPLKTLLEDRKAASRNRRFSSFSQPLSLPSYPTVLFLCLLNASVGN